MNTLPNFAGVVRLKLRLRGSRVDAVALGVARPNAGETMRGRAADEAARLLPLLYSICSEAQGTAARLAVAAARGAAQAPYVDRQVLAEGRREHLWRLLLDWPRALGLPRSEALLADGLRHLHDCGYERWRDGVLPAPLARFDAVLGELAGTRLPTRWLPPMTAAQTLAQWPRLDAGFAAAPLFDGAPAETGALARHEAPAGAATLAARVRARIADLFAADAGLGRSSAVPVAPGVGRAVVETARGLLMHEVAIDGDRVADYTIVAPTEWNFHAEGVLKAGLPDLAAPTAAALRGKIERCVLALDPCVACEIVIED
jgi:hypothetical protein